MNTEAEVVKSEFFATIHEGKIAVLGEGFPPHELYENQIILTKEEYNVLKALNGDVKKVYSIIRNVLKKIEANNH